MVEYSEVRDIVHEILHSDYDVFHLNGNVLRFRGDDIYNPRVIPGPQGVPGPKGSDGISPTIDIYVTVDNESSDNPTCQVTKNVTNGGTICKYTLNFHGLKGIQGSQGLQGVKGENGEGINFNPNELISHVESLINSEETRIRSLIDNLDLEIKGDVIAMVDKALFWLLHLPLNIISGDSNFGEEDVTEYLQRLGFWETINGETRTKWSIINQTVDNIRTEVNELRQNGINYESLSSSLYNYISENQANAGMLTTWSKFMQLDNRDIQMLKWMSSGVRSLANSESAVAELFSAVRDTLSATEAYAGLSTKVEQLENDYVSTASLTSYVLNAINTSMAGVVTESTLEHAIATMYSRVNDNLAGVVTESTLDGAITELFAKNSRTKSSISTYVNGKISNIEINADLIVNLGLTIFNTLDSNSVVISNGTINVDTVLTGSVLDDGELFIKGHMIILSPMIYDEGSPSSIYIGKNSTMITKIPDNVYINAASSILINGTPINSSDENLKNIIDNVEISIEDIASTRIVNYEFKDRPGKVNSGTVAQDWQNILPNVVTVNPEDGTLGLDYSATALISSVTAAREIVKLKQENEELKQRLSILEEKLDNYLK